MTRIRILIVLALVAIVAGCESAPVTGRKQLMLVSESQAISASTEAYAQTLDPIRKQGKMNDDPEAWLASAKAVPGSWWTHWMKWLKPHAGKPVAARRKLGSAAHAPIEPAPGRYVKARAS